MKKFLLSLTLFAALLGVSFSASAQCTISNLVFNVKSITPGQNGSCTMVFDIGWDQVNNGGYEWSVAHIWQATDYPVFDYKKPPTSTELNNSKVIGTVGVKLVEGQWVIQSSYPHGNTPMLIGSLTVTSLPGQVLRFSVENVTKTFTSCPTDLSIKGDVWGSQNPNAQNNHCFKRELTFVPPAEDLKISGSLTCGFKDGLPDNKFSVEMISSSTSALAVKYDVYVDNGDGSFNAAEDMKVGYRTVTGQSVSNSGTYSASMLDYTPYSKDYAFINRNLWINAAATTSLGNQFTRLYKITNACSMPAASTANADYFDESTHGLHTIKGNVYGGQTRWISELGSASEFTTTSIYEAPAVNGGLDLNPTDAPIGNMIFSLVPGSYQEVTNCGGAGMVDFTFNTDGTFSINRSNKICVYRISFKYTVTNTITGQVSSAATVTVDFQQQSILPVSYKSFSATRSSNSQVVLEWETAMEEANRGFHVQRNTDGSWKNIGFVFSAAQGGNSSEVLKYAFKDANGSKGITQYRILQVDMDGKGKYSEVRAVRGLETAARITLFPNPSSTGSFNLMFEDGSSVRDVVVSDVSGRVVKQYKAVSGNTLTVDGLTDGFYTVQVANRNSGTISIEKVIIKKR